MSKLLDVKRKPIYISLRDGVDENGNAKYISVEIMYSLEGFAYLEEKYGSLETAMKEFETGKITPIKDILYAGILHNYDYTPEDLAKRIDVRDLKEMAQTLKEVLTMDLEPETASPNK